MNKYGGAILCLALLFCGASARAQDTVEITVNDFTELEQALSVASQQGPNTLTSIIIVGQINWPVTAEEPELPPVRTNVRITGGRFGEIDGGGADLFIVEASGKLTVSGSQFVDIPHVNFGPVIFDNQGELVIENVGFTSVKGHAFCISRGCGPSHTALIRNRVSGKLVLRGVRFADSGSTVEPVGGTPDVMNGILSNEGTAELIRTQVYLSHNRWEQPLWNAGFMRLQNSSFMVRNDPNIPSLDLLELTDEAQTESVNSVFEGFTGTWCGQVESLGHNSTSAPDCTWASRGDTVGTSTGLIWRPVAGSFNLIPRAVSSIIDSADRSWCPDDGREIFDGNGDGTAACDRGAVEFMPASLAEGGVNGLYYNPDADGHYVYVLDNDHNTMVLWTTFDRDGNQAWIFGIGDLTAGRSISTQAYINLDGRITLDGNIEAAQAEEWGRLDVDMTNCWEGVVSFTSDRPEFGSGQFEIRRLAFVKQIGCIDSS